MAKSRSQPPPPQNVAVVLRIGNGSFDEGFPVTLQIFNDGRVNEYDDLPRIPAAPEMSRLYQEWQARSQEGSRKFQAVPGQVTNVAEEDWKQTTERLKTYCRTWFKNQAFSNLSAHIRANEDVRTDQSVPIIIRCETKKDDQNQLLKRLPWNFWNLFTDLPNAEFALFTKAPRQVATLAPIAPTLKVLAIFGTAQGGLKFEQDMAALERLRQRGAKIITRSEPSGEQLSHLLFEEAWDILFFAGHSSSTEASSTEDASGRIQIRPDVLLPLEDLQPGLAKAVRNGLKLAIFNSCDGLGIADFLASLNVPAMIVMREPVPDFIAGLFLIYFLEQFSKHTPLCLAIREARDRLRVIEGEFPAASWLPVSLLNPNLPELVLPPPTRQSPTTTLLSRLLPCLRRPSLLIGLVALVGMAVAIPVIMNRCQFLPSICISQVEPFISSGEKPVSGGRIQLAEPYRSLKQQGIDAFANGRYEDAVRFFDILRNQATLNRATPDLKDAALAALQDPEVLIYRNNAVVNARYAKDPGSPMYTIAVAAPLNLDAGMSIVLGVAQAQDVVVNAANQEINLQVIIANDSNKPDQARWVAEKLSSDNRILAVVGHYTSPNTCRALSVYSPHNMVIVAPTSTVVNLQSNLECGGDPNKVFFRTVSSSRVEARTLVEYFVNNLNVSQPKVVAFYNSQELFSKDLFDQFEQVLNAFNGSVIATFDLSDPNFHTNQLPSLVQNADALAVLPDGGTGDTTAFQKAIDILRLNNGQRPVLGANTLYLQDVVNQVGKALINRLFVAVDWHPQQCNAELFAAEVNKYWGGDLNRRTALAYEAVQAILHAIKLAGPSATRLDIRQKLADTGIRDEPGIAASSAIIDGLSISFDARGDRREITTRAIVTVNDQLRFDLAKDGSCAANQPPE